MPRTNGRTYATLTIETADNGFKLVAFPPQISPLISHETVHETEASLMRQVKTVLESWRKPGTAP
jgi:hypothetical protein